MTTVSLSRRARRRSAMGLLVLLVGTVAWVPEPCDAMDAGHHGDTEGAELHTEGSLEHGHGAVDPAAQSRHGHATHHGYTDAAETHPADAPDHSDAPVCAMMGHCTATLPGPESSQGIESHEVHEDLRAAPGWSVHPAPPSHLTPPPKR